jgi:hypothetical protein
MSPLAEQETVAKGVLNSVPGRQLLFGDRGFDAKKWDAAASHLISAFDVGKPTIS